METKKCSKCGEIKSLTDFNKKSERKDGRRSECRECQRKSSKNYSEGRTEEQKLRQKEWYLKNKDRVNAKTRERWHRNPDKFREIARNAQRKYKYGITKEEFAQMLQEQRGLCANPMCEEIATCVDHCHSSHKVRGLLCNSCNLSLGRIGDNPDKLMGLAAYVRKWKEDNKE